MLHRRPRLAYPFTILSERDVVRLVAGEDYRYTLKGPDLERWLPAVLGRCTGQEALEMILDALAPEQCNQATSLIERLYGERVLVDGPAQAAHCPRRYAHHVSGSGALFGKLQGELTADDGRSALTILCQDNLDYEAALAAGRAARSRGEPFLWTSYGAMQRAYVSPLFLPDAGPCFACLLSSFRRLSPAPEIYEALLSQGNNGKAFTPAAFPDEGIDILEGLVRWKLVQAEATAPAAALYRLHVLELASFEVSAHRVFVDVECHQCRKT